MAYTYYDFEVDPWNSDTPSYRLVSSAYYSGSLANVTAPASPNYPLTTPTRYLIKLPFIIDVSDLTGTRPIQLRNVTDSVTMTRVSGAPGTNEYRVPPATSERRNVIEINALQASKSIGFSLYAIGGVMRAEDFNSIDITGNITAAGTMTVTGNISGAEIIATTGFRGLYRTSAGSESAETFLYKVLEIGDWDMDANSGKTVAHGLGASYKNIISYHAIIRDDSDSGYYLLDSAIGTGGLQEGGVDSVDSTNFTLVRTATASGGQFDSTSFDSTPYNRGWIFLVYRT